MAKDNYGAESLTVLEGLDAVRKRPGMYIGTTDSQGLMHCLWEIIDNAVDEALAGACNHIIVTLHDDGSVEVADNGRGIPVDVEPKTKLTGVEVVLTKLHAGAKFGNSSYGASGGLHGVGSSVVNALSSRLDVEVDRDGKTHHMAFHQGHPGVYSDVDPEHPSPDSPFKKTRKNRPTELEIIGKVSPKTTGTRIRYWADPEIFNDTAEFSYDQLIDRVRQTSFLVPGLKITVIDENIPETGDESIDEMLEVDDNVIEQVTEENTSAETDDIGTSADILQEDSAEADESAESQENDAATQSQETVSQPVQPKYPHARVEEFCHTGGVKDFVDFLSKGEAVSDIWRIAGEDTYVEETQAVGDDGELHAQKVTRDCAVDIAMRWTNGYDTTMRSFVNVVETPGGGMHVDGFLQGITKQVRKAIEVAAINIIMDHGGLTRQQKDEIGDIYTKMQSNKDPVQNYYYDDLFHNAIMEAAGNKRLIEISNRMRLQISRARWLNFVLPERMGDAEKEHEKIQQALMKGDREACVESMSEHLNRSEQNFQKVLSSPEYAPQFAMAMSYISSLSRKNREK